MLSHKGNQHIKSNRNTPCKLSRCFFMALLCFQVSSPALNLCQCHSNVSGCVIVLSRQHFSEESVKGCLFVQDLWSAACSHTHTIRSQFIFRQPHADCILSDLISVKKFGGTLLGLRHHPGKVSRN